MPKDGLAAFGDDLLLDLAGQTVSGEEYAADSESMERSSPRPSPRGCKEESLIVDDGPSRLASG